jgi:ABC-type multidrug transport system ATPase subunit
MIEATSLTKAYASGQAALQNVSFAVEAGEIFGLLGPNGSGKTTAVRIFVTLLQRTSGTASVGGLDVARDRAQVRQLIGYAGQYVGVDQDLSVRENLLLNGRLHGLTAPAARARSDDLMDALGLTVVADQRAGLLSGGTRRRLDLAQAMTHKPAALFLDEPTTGLDIHARTALWAQLEELAGGGTTILVTTQYLEEADRLCRRVAILDHGEIVTAGTPEALKMAVGDDRVTLYLQDPHDREQRALVHRVASSVPGALNIIDDQDTVTVQLRSAGDSLLELVHRLDVEGVALARITLVPTTLDDVFIAYTGRIPSAEVASGSRSTSLFAAIHGASR